MSESSDFFNDLKKILVWIYSLLNYILAGIFTRTILNSEKLQLFPRVFSFFSRIALSLSRFFFFSCEEMSDMREKKTNER